MNRPTWAEIDLEKLAANLRRMRRHVGETAAMMAVVKADAYGHDAVLCARKLAAENVEWFGVALPEEAAKLRENQIAQPILSLGGFFAGEEKLLLNKRITPVVYRLDMAESLNRAAREADRVADVHVKIDTGMNRLGVRFDAIAAFADELKRFENLRVDGLMTHFAAADDADSDCLTNDQIKQFNCAVEIFREKGFRPAWLDLANSPGALAHARAGGNLVRIGGALYGIGKDIFPASATVEDLLPVMQLKSQIELLKTVPANESVGYSCTFKTRRDSIIASVPLGYNDGLPRALSNVGKAIVGGEFAPIVGRVSMDLTLLDVTDIQGAKLHDEVVFIGEQNNKQIAVEDVAQQANTISYEITCGIGKRVPRRAKNE